MTDQQDLSLLTDEERAVLAQWDNTDINGLHGSFELLKEALIAARAEIARLQSELEVARMPIQGYRALEAENKRKDEMLRSLEWSGSYWDSVSGEVLSVCPECDAPHSDMGHLVDCKLDALLQSEKGGE